MSNTKNRYIGKLIIILGVIWLGFGSLSAIASTTGTCDKTLAHLVCCSQAACPFLESCPHPAGTLLWASSCNSNSPAGGCTANTPPDSAAVCPGTITPN